MTEQRKNQSFARRLSFAVSGLGHALRAEHSFKTQGVFFLLVIAGLAIFRPEPVWWAIIVLACAAVLAAELFNTAIEHLADHLHPEIHPSIRIVKDCAAAAVLVTVVGAVGAGMALAIHLMTAH